MRWLLIGYMYLFIHRPFEVWTVLGDVRLELLYMLMTASVWLVSPEKRWLPDGFHWAYGAFAVAVIVCWVVSPWNYIPRSDALDYLKTLACYLLLVTVIHDEQHLHTVILGFLVIMSIYMSHSLYEYIGGRHVVRMSTIRLLGINTSTGDANHFAHSIVYSLPFLVPCWVGARSAWVRLGLVGYTLLSGLCITLTGSRSALVGVLLCLAIMIWRSRYRWPLVLLAVLSAPGLWPVLPENLQKRFETLIDPSVGPKNAKESADLRWVGLRLGTELLGKFPLTGCGPGYWIPSTHSKVQSHNLYGQVMGEMGVLGIVTFTAILLVFAVKLWGLRGEYKRHPEWGKDYLYHVIQAVSLALFVMLVLGNCLHILFRYNWVWYGAFLVVAGNCVRRRAAEAAGGAGAPTGWPAAPTWPGAWSYAPGGHSA
jgi:hypothetical protein